MGVMVAGDTTVVGMDPVARALGASGREAAAQTVRAAAQTVERRLKRWRLKRRPQMGASRDAPAAPTARTFARSRPLAGVARRHARLATPDECVRVFGFPPGSMPPLGHRAECPTLMDAALTDPALREKMTVGGFVYPGAGAPHLVFRCLPAVLERATAATTLPVAESSVAREAARRAARSAAAHSAAASTSSADVDSASPPTGASGFPPRDPPSRNLTRDPRRARAPPARAAAMRGGGGSSPTDPSAGSRVGSDAWAWTPNTSQ